MGIACQLNNSAPRELCLTLLLLGLCSVLLSARRSSADGSGDDSTSWSQDLCRWCIYNNLRGEGWATNPYCSCFKKNNKILGWVFSGARSLHCFHSASATSTTSSTVFLVLFVDSLVQQELRQSPGSCALKYWHTLDNNVSFPFELIHQLTNGTLKLLLTTRRSLTQAQPVSNVLQL